MIFPGTASGRRTWEGGGCMHSLQGARVTPRASQPSQSVPEAWGWLEEGEEENPGRRWSGCVGEESEE